jgi:hypothetical protein
MELEVLVSVNMRTADIWLVTPSSSERAQLTASFYFLLA